MNPLASNSVVPPTEGGAATDLPTACVLCTQNCGLRVDTTDNRITAVRADPDNPISQGYSCNKAYRIAHYADHRQRLTRPLARQPDGSYQPISWDQATTEIGQKLATILQENGPDAFAMLGIGGQGNHLSALFALSLLVGTGSRWWFNALAQEKTQRSLVDGWMLGSSPDVMLVGHLEEADYAVILGSNPLISQRGVAPAKSLRAMRKDAKRTLVVVDPSSTETARGADLHLAITPGTDVYLLLAIAAVIVAEGLTAESFLAAHTVGFDAVAGMLAECDVDTLAQRCGIEPAHIRSVARDFAAAPRAAIDLDLGLEQSRFNTLSAYLVRLILALTDNLGRVGGSVFVGTFAPPLSGMAPPSQPAPVSGIPGIALFAPFPMYSPNLFAEEVLRDDPGRIRAVIVEGSNPVLTYADRRRTEAAFAALELSIVIEPAWTETAALADYVLPTPVGYEKWEYSTFPKPFPLLAVQVRPPVLTGPQDALPEAEIYRRIGLAMGLVRPAPRWLARLATSAKRPLGVLLYGGALGLRALASARDRKRVLPMVMFWLLESLGPILPAAQLVAIWVLCHGVAWTRRGDVLRGRPDLGGLRTPMALGNALFDEAMAHPEGVVLGHVDSEDHLAAHIGHPDGRVRLAPPQMLDEVRRALAEQPRPDPAFPFILDGGMRTHWTANTNFRDPAWRKGRGPHCALRMNPGDAATLGLATGDRARVRTRRGAVELPVLVVAHVHSGHVHIPNGFGTRYPDPETGELREAGVCINDLTDAQDRDPFTGCPHHKYVGCQVERVG